MTNNTTIKTLVDYDNSLNELAWGWVDWMHSCENPVTPDAFNSIKPWLKVAITNWLQDHSYLLKEEFK